MKFGDKSGKRKDTFSHLWAELSIRARILENRNMFSPLSEKLAIQTNCENQLRRFFYKAARASLHGLFSDYIFNTSTSRYIQKEDTNRQFAADGKLFFQRKGIQLIQLGKTES